MDHHSDDLILQFRPAYLDNDAGAAGIYYQEGTLLGLAGDILELTGAPKDDLCQR